MKSDIYIIIYIYYNYILIHVSIYLSDKRLLSSTLGVWEHVQETVIFKFYRPKLSVFCYLSTKPILGTMARNASTHQYWQPHGMPAVSHAGVKQTFICEILIGSFGQDDPGHMDAYDASATWWSGWESYDSFMVRLVWCIWSIWCIWTACVHWCPPRNTPHRERLVLFPKALVVPLVEAIVPFPEAMDLGFSGALIHLRLVEGHLLWDGVVWK